MTQDSAGEPKLTPVQKFGEVIADFVERWMPNPFLFAIILTYVAAVTAWLSEGSSPAEIAFAWYDGFWVLLTFAMQMVIILVTGFVVAYHPVVKRGILWLVRLPRNGRQAVVLVGVGSMLTGWISWGLGLIFGAILAREMGKVAHRGSMAVHYPLLAVAGYMGMSLTWGWGMSSSAGLLQATDNNVFMQMGIVDRVIPASEWVFHPYPLLLTGLALAYGCLMLYLLAPPDQNCRGIARYVPEEADADDASTPAPAIAKPSPADRINHSRVLGGIIALTGVVMLVREFVTDPMGALDLNVFNFGFLMIGMLLFISPSKYQDEFTDAVKGSAGIILQFPFYAGIVGIMTGTGLVNTMTESLLALSTADNFPVGHLDHGRHPERLRALGGERMGHRRGPDDAGRGGTRRPARPNHRRLRRRRRAHQPLQPLLGDPAARHHGPPRPRHVRLRHHDDDPAGPVHRPGAVLPAVLMGEPCLRDETDMVGLATENS